MRNQFTFLVLATSVSLSACSDNSEKSAALKDTATDTVQQTEATIEEKAATLKETATEKVDAASAQVAEITEQAKSSVDEQVESVKTDAQKLVSIETADKATETVDKTTAAVASVTTTATTAPEAKSSATDHALGKKIYSSSCQACHATGAAGAPKLGDKPNWAPRIAAGIDKMSANAINGFQGSTGFMPAKGGAAQLSDEEVTAAVAYMVSESR